MSNESNTEKKGKAGRQQVITVEVAEKVCRRMAQGLPRKDACLAEGVSEATFRWAIRFRKELGPVVDRERARFLAWAMDEIIAGRRNWQSLAWLLERRHRELYGRQAEVQVNNAVVVGLSAAELKIVREAAKEMATGKPVVEIEGKSNVETK